MNIITIQCRVTSRLSEKLMLPIEDNIMYLSSVSRIDAPSYGKKRVNDHDTMN